MFKLNISFLSYINLILILAPILLYAQGIHLLGQIKYGDLDYELAKSNTYDQGSFYDLIPDDLEIDSENNIYLCDRTTKKILKFSPQMELIFVKEIPQELLMPPASNPYKDLNLPKHFSKVDLETDKMGNLYVLVSIEDIYITLIKLNDNGKLITGFHLAKPVPQQHLTDFFISADDKIFVNTFPINVVNPEYVDNGLVFVYDLEGNFLGRTDYFIEDSEGNAYQRNLLTKDYLQIDKYYPNTSGKVGKTSEKKLEENMKITYSNQKSWHFLGVDKFDNLYFTNGKQNVTVRKFNFSGNTIEDKNIEEKDLINIGVLFANNFSNIALTAEGDIIICGIQNTSGIKSLNDSYNINEVSVVVMKLTWKEYK